MMVVSFLKILTSSIRCNERSTVIPRTSDGIEYIAVLDPSFRNINSTNIHHLETPTKDGAQQRYKNLLFFKNQTRFIRVGPNE